jgi:hypothetical protein
MANRLPRCSICKHPERGRLDYLCVTQPFAAVARKFNVSADALERHFRNHVTEDFKRSVKIGPFESEDRLRKLCAESGTSIIENLRAVYAGLAQTWLAAVEAGASLHVVQLSREMRENLAAQARITGELMPGVANVTVNNTVINGDFIADLGRDLIELARQHPAIKADLMAVLRRRVAPAETPLLIEASDAS